MRKHLILFIALVIIMTSGCAPKENVEIIEEMPEVVYVNRTPYGQMLLDEMLAEKAFYNESRPKPVVVLEINPIFESIRPLAVMIDNQLDARPQSGLEQSKVVYEILAEGSITRYMMLVEPKEDFLIGPVRSARPYFIAYAMEYGSLYAHAGGSVDGLNLIEQLDTDNLNGLKAGSNVYWRENHRKMPHNLYTSVKGLMNDIKRLKYSLDPVDNGTVQQYNRFVSLKSDSSATAFTVTYKAPSARDSIGYSVSYDYDNLSKLYFRSVNNQPQLDEATGARIDAGSVIVFQADHRVLDSAGRREIDIVGSGDGIYLSMGQSIPITWEKASLTAPTIYKDSDGENLIVNPGRLFIQVVDNMNQLTIKGE
jgi:hypothetical protein